MTRKLDYRWNLRQVVATRGMFQTTDCRTRRMPARFSPSAASAQISWIRSMSRREYRRVPRA